MTIQARIVSFVICVHVGSYCLVRPEMNVPMGESVFFNRGSFGIVEDALPTHALARLGGDQGSGQGHTDRITGIAFLDEGRRLVSTSWDDTIRIWSTETAKELKKVEHQTAAGSALALSPNGKLIASGCLSIALWDASNLIELREWKPVEFTTSSLAFSPDSRLLASADTQEMVHLWDVANGKEVHKWRQQKAILMPIPVAFGPDGLFVASTGRDLNIRLWEVATGRQRASFPGGDTRTSALTFSPDGKLLASGTEGGIITLWDAAVQKQLRTIRPNNGAIYALTFSNDGRMLACGTSNDRVSLWEVCSGLQRRAYVGHKDSVTCIAFSPKTNSLASGSDDKTVLVWRVWEPLVADKGQRASITSEMALRDLWQHLGDLDGAKSYEAMLQMAAYSEHFVTFAKQMLTQGPKVNSQQIERLIKQLDSPEFEQRKQAMKELEQMGYIAELPLLKSLASKPSLELARNLQILLKKVNNVESPYRLRQIRAIEVLEHIRGPSARSLLAELAKGDPRAFLTKEAKKSLDRLQQKTSETN